MPVVRPEKLVALQRTPDCVRNICVLAHVDHGKTSLTDSLIATNGIISTRMAGKIRYLDSRPDEQIRGITMESSAISLLFSLLRKSGSDSAPEQKDHLINLIDSPGHVDFSSEVSTASRLCDGAIVLVDAVEGVCSQTIAVLRQTWVEHLKPVLVINKMDRLITELKMSPGEAYNYLARLLEQVNAVVGSFFQGERMEDDLKWRERLETKLNETQQADRQNRETEAPEDDNETEATQTSYEEKEDEDIYFEPERGNVIFASAIDGWAFTVKQFAGFYEKKLGIKRSILEKVLWGDYYLDPKTKRVLGSKHLKGRALKPMFVQLVLDQIWAVYEASTGGSKGKGDPVAVEKITKALSLNLPAHVLRSRDPHAILTALVTAWIPLSTAVLVTVIEHLPSPAVAQATRTPGLLDASPGAPAIDITLRESMAGLKSSKKDPLVAFVSKMVAVAAKDLPENKTRSGTALSPEEARELGRKKRAEIARAQAIAQGEEPDLAELREALSEASIDQQTPAEGEEVSQQPKEDDEKLIGFARLFSGTLEVGDEIHVLPPKYTPANPNAHPKPQKVTVTALYLMMGRELEALTSVPAGVVFGIGGLENIVMKSATLCSQVEGGVNLAGVSMGGQPIVRVALEPENPADMHKLESGLKILQQSDPCASFEILPNGEVVILTAGELHLERCLKDLRERFAKCEVQVGEPIVPYRESIVSAPEMNPPKNKEFPRGTAVGTVSSKMISVRVRVRPLPSEVTELLLKNGETIRDCYRELGVEELKEDIGEEEKDTESEAAENGNSNGHITHQNQPAIDRLTKLKSELESGFKELKRDREVWQGVVEKIIGFGPRRTGPNLFIDTTTDKVCDSISLTSLIEKKSKQNQHSTEALAPQDFAERILYAFQLTTAHGPLCQEPLQGVAVFLEEVSLNIPPDSSSGGREYFGRLTGEIIRPVREAINQGFLDWSPRMMLAMYSCEIQASTEVLGRVYGVITRRRGRILDESMNEGTPFFTITAVIPVAESFGFSDEIRKRTSGQASPQLLFAGYEMLDEDPFWVPFTEEELEDLGDTADRENVAKRYMDKVRRRKGLYVKETRVQAEKQKTLKK